MRMPPASYIAWTAARVVERVLRKGVVRGGDASGRIPIDSYHDAFSTSYVASIETVSPSLSETRHSGRVAFMLTSQETAPAGS